MNKSQTISELAKALLLFHLKVDRVKKDAKNPFFKSSYSTLDNILEVIALPLSEAGLTFAQFPSGEHGLTTILIHAESGEFIESEYFMAPVKNSPQDAGSVITYQRRYALAAVLGLAQEDDDANTATHGGKTPETAEDNSKPWLNKGSKEFAGAVKKLQEGKTTLPKIREFFKVSKEVEGLLTQSLTPQLN